MVRIPKGLFMGLIVGGFVGGIALIILGIIVTANGNRSEREVGQVIVLLGYLPMIASGITHLVLVYKLWDAIQEGRPRTTPGMAVGLLFIPCFSLYWIFQVYHGWAVDYNRYIDDEDIDVPRVTEGLPQTGCILMLCGIIPYIGIPFYLIGIICLMVFFGRAIDAVNELADAPPGRGRYDDDDDDYYDRRRSRRSRSRRRDYDDDYDDRRGRSRGRDRDRDDYDRPSRGRSRDDDDDDRGSPRRRDDRISDRPSRPDRDDEDDDR